MQPSTTLPRTYCIKTSQSAYPATGRGQRTRRRTHSDARPATSRDTCPIAPATFDAKSPSVAVTTARRGWPAHCPWIRASTACAEQRPLNEDAQMRRQWPARQVRGVWPANLRLLDGLGACRVVRPRVVRRGVHRRAGEVQHQVVARIERVLRPASPTAIYMFVLLQCNQG